MEDNNLKLIVDDEIDFTGLLTSLWEYRWTIISITMSAIIMSVVFVLLPVHTYKGTIEIMPVFSDEESKYLQLNDARRALGSQLLEPIDKDVLLNTFTTVLSHREVFYPFVESSGLIKKMADERDLEYRTRISQSILKNISIEMPSLESGKVYKPFSTMTVKTKEPTLMREVLLNAFNAAEMQAKAMIDGVVQREIALKQERTDVELNALAFKYKDALSLYDEQIVNQLAFLEEQESIARSLGVPKSTIDAETFTVVGQIVANLQNDAPYYLRGYEAISKEIELIKSRREKAPYISELLEINSKIRRLKNDQSVALAQDALAVSPLKKGAFKAGVHDVFSMELESKTRSLLPVVFSFFIGGILGVVVALTRAGFKKSNMRQQRLS